jgi:phosphoribosyl 1,2-cyclic phosphodiesterase
MHPVRAPSLSVRTLASGSSGNLAVVRGNDTVVALDLGVSSLSGMRASLASAGVALGDLEAAIVSHAHSDHLGWYGLREAIQAQVPVLAGEDTCRVARDLWLDRVGLPAPDAATHPLRAGTTYLIGQLEVTPFEVSHDVPTFGFVFATRAAGLVRKLVVATDLGCAPDALLPRFADADAVLLEANYDPDLLGRSRRHPRDKERVASDRGHLSNAQAGDFLRRCAEAGSRLPSAVLLVHLSRDHNLPALALDTVRRESGLGDRLPPLAAAPRRERGPLIEV